MVFGKKWPHFCTLRKRLLRILGLIISDGLVCLECQNYSFFWGRIAISLIILTKKNSFRIYYKSKQESAFICFQVVGLTMAIVLLWHRITWGFAEWIHEAWFYNFWNGTYVVIACKCTQCGNLAIFLPLRFYKEKLSNFHTVK